MAETKQFWMVLGPDFGPARYKHDNIESARGEARRLAERGDG
jgi:hypothetical protein